MGNTTSQTTKSRQQPRHFVLCMYTHQYQQLALHQETTRQQTVHTLTRPAVQLALLFHPVLANIGPRRLFSPPCGIVMRHQSQWRQTVTAVYLKAQCMRQVGNSLIHQKS